MASLPCSSGFWHIPRPPAQVRPLQQKPGWGFSVQSRDTGARYLAAFLRKAQRFFFKPVIGIVLINILILNKTLHVAIFGETI